VPITTKVVSSNPIHGNVYSIQHYVIKFLSDLRQVGGFSPVSSTNKPDRHDITEILLKLALNTINQTKLYRYLKTVKYDLFVENSAFVDFMSRPIYELKNSTRNIFFSLPTWTTPYITQFLYLNDYILELHNPRI